MWNSFLLLSVCCMVLIPMALVIINKAAKKKRINVLGVALAGVFSSAFFAFLPIHLPAGEIEVFDGIKAVAFSVIDATKTFGFGSGYDKLFPALEPNAGVVYQAWVLVLIFVAPLLTFGFALSFFKNVTAKIGYLFAYCKKAYIFSELNEKSLALATDIKTKNPRAKLVFTDVFENNEEKNYELIERAKQLGASLFKKDILVMDFKMHSRKAPLFLFAIGKNQTENLNHALKLIESYKTRSNTHLYVFSTKPESELMLAAVDKGKIKVRRINEVQSLVNHLLYTEGEQVFETARATENGNKKISAVIVGMGRHGTEMTKALAWFGQMDGYELEITAFDKDPLAEKKFTALAPELMSPKHNGVSIEGEAQYKITVKSAVDVSTAEFEKELSAITDASFVLVALGNDDKNVSTAIRMRTCFERMKIHPAILAIVYNPEQRRALKGIKNYRGQEYDIQFIGDIAASYTEDVIINSELEKHALNRHLKWGDEEEFWTYEYNYRSSTASAIHLKARIKCSIAGADKTENELTDEERTIIETLEHRRWNAYMRAEGYVYTGSRDKSSRNDLAKMHHDLVPFAELGEEDKRKDSPTVS